jgi:hypothetical protein
LLAGSAIAGCGADDFPNEARAAAPFETTASLGPKSVNVSPNRFGAGLTVVTVANLSNNPAGFELRSDGTTAASSGEIAPHAVTTIKADLKQGNYQAIATGTSGLKPGTVEVGPPRASSQNDVLLP